jgi:serine/threonine protein kinase
VSVHEFGLLGLDLFLLLDLCEGGDLRSELATMHAEDSAKTAAVRGAAAAAIGQMAAAVRHIDAMGVVHRDIKVSSPYAEGFYHPR